MGAFRLLYLDKCSELHVEPNFQILAKLGENTDSSCLNLSRCSLSVESCEVLGTVLSQDVSITDLDFSDCMLLEEGLVEILKGLEQNKCVRSLNLQGNNIRSSGAQALGKFLRHNDYLQNLNLKWNTLGILPEKFFIFCEGLITNSSLKQLDLTNNQLDQQCAGSIANALVKNTNLQLLALEWNNLGLLGGQALMQSIPMNSSLLKLDITGNNFPLEVETGIAIAIRANNEKMASMRFFVQQSRILSRKLEEAESDKSGQVKLLQEALDRHRNDTAECEKASLSKISCLEKELADREVELNNMNGKLEKIEVCLKGSDNQIAELTGLLNQKEQEVGHLQVLNRELLDSEKKARQCTELELRNKLGNAENQIFTLEQELIDFKKREELRENDCERLRRDFLQVQEELKVKQNSHLDEINRLELLHQEELKAKDSMKQNEVSKWKGEFESIEEFYKSRIKNLENQITEFENQISGFENKLKTGKIKFEDLLDQEKTKAKQEMVKFESALEKKVTAVETSKLNVERMLNEQLEVMGQLRSKVTQLDIELDQQHKETEILQKQLAMTGDQHTVRLENLKNEIQTKKQELEQFTLKNQELVEHQKHLSTEIEEMKRAQETAMVNKEIIICDLKKKLALCSTRIECALNTEKSWHEELHNVLSSCLSNE